jgi:hypothetical protein
MRVRAIDASELVVIATFEARYDLASFEDGNVLNGYNCGCRRCVN